MSQESISKPAPQPSNQTPPPPTPPESSKPAATATTETEAKPPTVADALSPGGPEGIEDPRLAKPELSPTQKLKSKKRRQVARLMKLFRSAVRELENGAASLDLTRQLNLAEMEENDLLVQFNISLSTGDGAQLVIKGSSSLPDIFADHVLPRALNSFETLVAANIVDPLLARFQTLLNGKANTDESRQLPGAGLGLQSQRPVVPPRIAPARPPSLPSKG